MIPEQLIGKIQNFNYNPDRPKVSGRMWGGSAEIIHDNLQIELQLWYHGGDEETADSLKPQLTIKFVNGKDAYWHCLISKDAIWFHERGWFHDEKLREQITEAIKPNPHFNERKYPADKLLELGFIKVF